VRKILISATGRRASLRSLGDFAAWHLGLPHDFSDELVAVL
jgi:hypothetical protein